MHISRMLVVTLLVSLCGAPLVAQSSPDNRAAYSGSWSDELVAPPEFRGHTATPLQGSQSGAIVNRLLLPTRPKRLSYLALPEDDRDCYTIRSYRVVRDDPQSDSTRIAGYSTCLPAARAQVKTAVESREVVP